MAVDGNEKLDRRQFLARSAIALNAASALSRTQTAFAGETLPPSKWTILVTIDTLRRDHCTCYGYPRKTTPWLDRLATQGVQCVHAYAHTGVTYPSHATMLTGLELPQHGVMYNGSDKLNPAVYSMGELFAEEGYDTAAFVSVRLLERLRARFGHFAPVEYKAAKAYQWAEETLPKATAWLEKKGPNDKVFLWVHVFDAHEWLQDEPQNKVESMQLRDPQEKVRLFHHWTEKQGKHLTDWGRDTFTGDLDVFCNYQNNYDARIRYVDNHLAEFYDFVESQGPQGDILWMVTSDHGEGLGQHRLLRHGGHMYEQDLAIPLVFHHDSGAMAGRRVLAPVCHADLMPTMAEMLGVSLEGRTPPVQSISLWQALQSGGILPERMLFAHRMLRDKAAKNASKWEMERMYAMHNHRHKYIVHEEEGNKYFNLRQDPLELKNLLEGAAGKYDDLRVMTEQRFDALTASGAGEDLREDLSPAEVEELQALGYL